MADTSKIEWTDATWNPVTGCTKVSPGCDNCYAETFAERWRGTPGHHFETGFDVTLRPERVTQPLRWRTTRRIFVNSMSDLFHEGVSDEFIARVFAVMALAPQHTFQVLTKRHGRMKSLLDSQRFVDAVWSEMERLVGDDTARLARTVRDAVRARIATWNPLSPWPLPNVWLGVSVENQKWADIRVPALLDTPAALRFLSCEPLLGPLDLHGPFVPGRGRPKLTYWLSGRPYWDESKATTTNSGLTMAPLSTGPRIDWVIVGGESGPRARPMHPQWVRTIRDQCLGSDVPFFFKQWGEYACAVVEDDPKFAGGRAYEAPGGGRRAAVIRERGGSFRGGALRAMKPGDATCGGVLLDADTIAVRVGKKTAGRELDGQTWNEFPQSPHGA